MGKSLLSMIQKHEAIKEKFKQTNKQINMSKVTKQINW